MRGIGRKLAGAILALGLLAGCSSGGGTTVSVEEDAAAPEKRELTASFLAQAAERSQTSEAYRFEMWVDMDMGGSDMPSMSVSSDAPMVKGVQAGDKMHMAMDLRPMFEQMVGAFAQTDGGEPPPELEEVLAGDLTMEMVVDGAVLYLRAPFLTAMASLGGTGATGMPPGLSTLGDRWGKVDLASTSPELAELITKQLTGGQGSDPSAFFDLLRQAAGELTDLGPGEVRGVAVRRYAAEVTLGDMLATQGMDASQLGLDAGGMPVDKVLAMAMPVEVSVDGDDLVRSMVMRLDMGEVFRGLEAEGGDVPSDVQFVMTMRAEFFEYGAEGLRVEAPAEAVDITEEFGSLQGAP